MHTNRGILSPQYAVTRSATKEQDIKKAVKAVRLQNQLLAKAAVAFNVDKEVLRSAIEEEHKKNALNRKDYNPSERNRFEAKLCHAVAMVRQSRSNAAATGGRPISIRDAAMQCNIKATTLRDRLKDPMIGCRPVGRPQICDPSDIDDVCRKAEEENQKG